MPKHPADVLDTQDKPERVIIRSYPKVIVYYPTMVVAFLCAAWTAFSGDGGAGAEQAGRLFFFVFFFNTLTIAFDFSRVVFVASCLFFGLLVTLAFLLETKQIPVFGAFKSAFEHFSMAAKPSFFAAYGICFVLIFIGVFIESRFNYWEVKHNEILHHHGIAGDVARYDARNLRMTKEITDVFEYVLLFSGRLVFEFDRNSRPIVLDHVVRINAMEKRIERMLQTLQVRVQSDGPSAPPPAS